VGSGRVFSGTEQNTKKKPRKVGKARTRGGKTSCPQNEKRERKLSIRLPQTRKYGGKKKNGFRKATLSTRKQPSRKKGKAKCGGGRFNSINVGDTGMYQLPICRGNLL